LIKRVTLADVARQAGVSMQTVSRAVRNKDEISTETRERIMAIVNELGYRPSGIARSLVTQRTTTVGLMVPDIANPFFSEIARGVEDTAYAHAYTLFLCNAAEDIEREKAALNSLLEKQVDGVIICSPRLPMTDLLAYLEQFYYAVVFNRDLSEDIDKVRLIYVDDQEGTRLAWDHFVLHGHQKIGMLAGPVQSWSSQKRVAIFRAACKSAGLDGCLELIQHCMPTIAGGLEGTERLLIDHPEITAILAFNDLVAIGALRICQKLGRRVPQDIEIIGSDDIPLASLMTPPLTSLHVPHRTLGVTGMQSLIQLLNGEKPDPYRIIFHPELTLRCSAP